MIGFRAAAILLISTLGVAAIGAIDLPPPDWSDVQPVFAARCVNCHGASGAAKELRLDSYAGATAGSTDGPVLLAGDPEGSELVKRLRGQSVPRMPFLGPPLPPEELDLIVHWVEAGLPETAE